MQRDSEGSTALHWAAFHDSAEGVRGLCDDLSEGALTDLLVLQDKAGLTACEVAVAEKSAAASAVLMELTERCQKRIAALLTPAATAAAVAAATAAGAGVDADAESSKDSLEEEGGMRRRARQGKSDIGELD